MVRSQFAQIGSGSCRPHQKLTWPAKLPQRALAVRGQVPERVVPRLRRAAGAELSQQGPQRHIHCGEVHQPRFVVLHPRERQQDQQRLVWRVDPVPLSAPDVVESFEDLRGGIQGPSPRKSQESRRRQSAGPADGAGQHVQLGRHAESVQPIDVILSGCSL